MMINIKNGHIIKRLIAKKVRDVGVDVVDHIMITKLREENGEPAFAWST